jgi:hypothetical protein
VRPSEGPASSDGTDQPHRGRAPARERPQAGARRGRGGGVRRHGIAARLTHPGNAAASSSRTGSTGNRATSSVSGDQQTQSSDGFTIAPSTAVPQAQTSVS